MTPDPATVAFMDQACETFRQDALTYAETAYHLAQKYGPAQAQADLGALLRSKFADAYSEDKHVNHLCAIAAAALMELGKTDVWRRLYREAGGEWLKTYGGTE